MKLNVKYLSIGVIVVAVLIGAGMHIYFRTKGPDPSPTFSFNQQAAEGWWGRENVNVQEVARTSDYTGEEPIEKLPVADTTLFHRDPKGTSERPADECFVAYSYYNYPIDDIEAAYESYFDDKAKTEGKLDTFGPKQQSIKTFEGEKQYELRQYRYVIEGQDNLEGYQVGFIPLSGGYVRTEGVCKTYEDLERTLPILGSVELLGP